MTQTSAPPKGPGTVPAPDAAAGGRSARHAVARRLLGNSNASILLILLAIVAIFATLDFSAFVSVTNARNVAVDVSILLVLAVGATFVIITAGIDLSVGAVLVFSGVVSVRAMEAVGGDGVGIVFVGLAAALASGLAWGLINGFLVAKAKLNPLIVTLGTLGMAFGFAQLVTEGIDLNPPERVGDFGIGRFFGEVPYLVVIAAVVAVVGAIVLAKTRFGRYTYACGSNFEAARRAGIAVDRHLIKVYGLAGLLAGLGGFLSLARFSSTTIAGHSNDALQVIAGVVIGGTSLFGGVGTILGTTIGVLIPGVLQNGFVVIGTQPFWQEVAVGAVLIAAVYMDQLRRRRRYNPR